MAQGGRSQLRALLLNIWLPVCILAAGSCVVLVVQLLLKAPPLDGEVLGIRVALGVPAALGAVAGFYGIVSTILLVYRTGKVTRLEHRLTALRRRAGDLETTHLRQRVRIDELSALSEMGTVVNVESDFALIAEKVLELIHGLLEPQEATMFLRDPEKEQMVPLAQVLAGKVVTGRKMNRREVPQDALADFERHGVICRVEGAELRAMVPLKVEEHVEGVLLIVFPADSRPAGVQTAQFNRQRRDLLTEVAQKISLAVKTKHLHTKAVVDGLTNLFSRSHFNDQLAAAVDMANRTGDAFSLVMMDIDHFKMVNDTYGHSAGDDVLQRVARRIRDKLRRYDTAYRYGGEEIAVLLPRASMEQATSIAERLRSTIEAQRVKADGHLIRVTISVGVAQFRRGDDADTILHRADRRLYRAKDSGRNRVVAAPI